MLDSGFVTTHLQLNTQVVLALGDGSLVSDAKIPAAQDLPRAVRRLVGKHVILLEGLGHAAERTIMAEQVPSQERLTWEEKKESSNDVPT